ncbi:T-cell immunoglobulin and mucin domain-containing protein 4-like [Anoplopoma fimbria]|uniref:T-cell immunoglobulin and mucin domain-containing protein 4-like n=1 Tax=Anoplopoma fimbria TaxID=229290 RepID=UPI0023EAF6B9|nr:T-cell immunoglobulin and mucin domain-containing protein 4-like [Anoplopoma fimbria]
MRGLCYFYLSILTQVSSSTLKVIGYFGHNVTLACSYDSQTHGVLSFCWGRGMVPTSKCSKTIVSSQDGVVLSRQMPRYQLLGRVTDGDVSLTILDAQRSDAGVYGCRIEIAGWFNDKKVNTELVLEEAPVERPVTQDWTLTAAERQEIMTTSLTKNVEVGFTTTVEKFKAFLEVGNIGRVAAISLSGIIIILIFVFRRRFLPKRMVQHLHTSTAENIYEIQ